MLRRRSTALPLAILSFAACAAPALPPPRDTAPAAPAALPVPAPPLASAAPTADAPPPAPTAEPAPPASPKPRLFSQGYVTWIYGRPKVDTRYIGYIRNGASVALRSTELVRGEGCKNDFWEVEPRGYVCNDHTVTRSPSARFLEAAEAAKGAPGPFPYRYALSDGAPMYNRVPTPEEQERTERVFGPAGDKRPPFKKHRSSYEHLATLDPIAPSDPFPAFLANKGTAAEGRLGLVKEPLPAGSIVSFTRAFAEGGRTFLLSADQTLVPADRVRPFTRSSFHGTRLGGDVKLPLAWMRGTDKPQYKRLPSGALEKTGGAWPVRTFVQLTGGSVEHDGKRFLETRARDADGGALYIAEKDATVAARAERMPNAVKPDQKWIVVSITQGTLVAYEGLEPVYATLMSPGRGGVPVPGHDNVEDSTTPLGTYNVTFKDKATTMSPDKPGAPRTHWIADVPHTQYFDPPFALHAATWHERFGEPTSAGCVNVSPIDAEALFLWSDPQVPEEWQGATGAGAPENGKTTAIVIRR
jgi:lipoprotein-anchoring transpeptidase ErfK/SrfK